MAQITSRKEPEEAFKFQLITSNRPSHTVLLSTRSEKGISILFSAFILHFLKHLISLILQNEETRQFKLIRMLNFRPDLFIDEQKELTLTFGGRSKL